MTINYKNLKSINEMRKLCLSHAKQRIQCRAHDRNELSTKLKSLSLINWISTKNNVSKTYVLGKYKIKDIKYLCSFFIEISKQRGIH